LEKLTKIFIREIERIISKRTLYMMILVMPTILFIFIGYIYKKEVIRDIPVGLINNDKSVLAGKFSRAIDAASGLKFIDQYNNMDEMLKAFMKGEIQGGIFVPDDFEKNIKSNKFSSIVVYKNSANIIIDNMITKDALTVIKTFSAGAVLKKVQSKGKTFNEAVNIINPVRIDTRSLYNPYYSYSNYLAPGLIWFTLQMLIMMSTVLIISAEFTKNTYHELLKISNNEILLIYFGKAIPHILLQFINSMIILGIIFPLFNIHITRNIFDLILFSLLFITLTVSIALMISSWFHDELFATELTVFINTPTFIFSGITFPTWSMPDFFRYIAEALPFTHFITGFTKLSVMNAELSDLGNTIIYFILLIIITVIGTVIGIKYKTKKYYGVEAKLVMGLK